MKSVLISIQPKWCEKIANGEKTIEVRKTKPKLETPFKCYIYETKTSGGKGKVIGEFICDFFDEFKTDKNGRKGIVFKRFTALYETCLSVAEMFNYGKGETLYGWHISNLVIYDKPKELSEFRKCLVKPLYENCDDCDKVKPCVGCGAYEIITRPPQSWCYVEK